MEHRVEELGEVILILPVIDTEEKDLATSLCLPQLTHTLALVLVLSE